MKYSRVLLGVLFAIVAVSAFSQKLIEKPFNKWSREDAMNILSQSAWAQTYFSTSAAAAADAASALRGQADNRLAGGERGRAERSGGPAPIVIRLHSGLPIRQALVRLNQLAAHYDKMDEIGKAKFDESAKRLIECAPCESHYVVTITKLPNPSGESVEEAIFQSMNLEQMKPNVWLKNEKGDQRELQQFIAPVKRGDSAVFFFAKKGSENVPFLTPASKDFSLVFNASFFNSNNRFASLLPRKFDFKASKLVVKDSLLF